MYQVTSHIALLFLKHCGELTFQSDHDHDGLPIKVYIARSQLPTLRICRNAARIHLQVELAAETLRVSGLQVLCLAMYKLHGLQRLCGCSLSLLTGLFTGGKNTSGWALHVLHLCLEL